LDLEGKLGDRVIIRKGREVGVWVIKREREKDRD